MFTLGGLEPRETASPVPAPPEARPILSDPGDVFHVPKAPLA